VCLPACLAFRAQDAEDDAIHDTKQVGSPLVPPFLALGFVRGCSDISLLFCFPAFMPVLIYLPIPLRPTFCEPTLLPPYALILCSCLCLFRYLRVDRPYIPLSIHSSRCRLPSDPIYLLSLCLPFFYISFLSSVSFSSRTWCLLGYSLCLHANIFRCFMYVV
jgi:hypothetical protein